MYQETIDLSHLPPEGLRLERRVNSNALKIREEDWESQGDLLFELFLQGNAGKTLVEGSFAAGITFNCHRCLERTSLDLRRSFHLTYVARDTAGSSKEEIELSANELEVAYLDGQFLSLQEMLREQIYLALPMKLLCKTDCRGLCIHCGADLNEVECACPTEQIDLRWITLKKIAQKEN